MRGPRRYDERERRYGKLTVIDRAPEKPYCWQTKCKCGGFRIADGRELRAGRITACKPCAKETKIKRLKRWHSLNGGKWDREAA